MMLESGHSTPPPIKIGVFLCLTALLSTSTKCQVCVRWIERAPTEQFTTLKHAPQKKCECDMLSRNFTAVESNTFILLAFSFSLLLKTSTTTSPFFFDTRRRENDGFSAGELEPSNYYSPLKDDGQPPSQ